MKNLFYILTLLLLITSCNKKWKKTSETNFDVEFITSKSDVSYLELESGFFQLTNFTFSGTRKKGNDVLFSEWHSSTLFEIENEEINPNLYYDIPQGEYTNITIDLRFDKGSSGKSITVEGVFKDSNEIDINFVFELEDRIDVGIVVTPTNGSTITIVAKEKTNPIITFDLVDWFEHIPYGLLDEAEATEIDGEEYLYINKTSNPSLYTLVVERIGETAKITFD